jgi:hypothetical protein
MVRQLDEARKALREAALKQSSDAPGTTAAALESSTVRQARADAARIRRVINEFRDDRWDSLLQIRSFMIQCAVIAMCASYVLFIGGLCGAANVEHKTAPVIITLYFVAGVFIGIFKQIYDASRRRVPALDMFNLLSVQLVVAPILSGFSAVLGVLIVGLIVPSAIGIDTNSAAQPLADASQLFDFVAYPKGLLIALAAGFAPSFVVGRLSKLAEQIGLDIDRTSVGSGDTIQNN